MNIQPYDDNQNNRSLSPIRKALKSEMVRNVNDKELLTTIARSISKAFSDSGQIANQTDANYLIQEMPIEIKKYHPNMRLEEIPIAIEKGVRGEYGEFYGLNVISFSHFIKSYIESELRKNEAKQLLKIQEAEKPVPTKEETFEKIKETIILAYQTYIKKGNYDDHGNFIYNKMDEMKLFQLDSETKQIIFEKAKTSLLFKNNPENAVNRSEFKSMSQTVDIINDDKLGKKTIQTEAKKIALNHVFEKFKAENINIKQIVNQTEAF